MSKNIEFKDLDEVKYVVDIYYPESHRVTYEIIPSVKEFVDDYIKLQKSIPPGFKLFVELTDSEDLRRSVRSHIAEHRVKK